MDNKNEGKKRLGSMHAIWDSLTDEQKAKAKDCKDLDELLELAGKEGIELPDRALDAVSGGYIYWDPGLPKDSAWQVVDDSTGVWLASAGSWEDAELWAIQKKVSTDVISIERREAILKAYQDSQKPKKEETLVDLYEDAFC